MSDILMSSSALPPLGNLPSWARVSSLDRNKFPKPFLRDRLATLPPTRSSTSLPSVAEDSEGEFPVASQLELPVEDVANLSPSERKRLVYYNKTIKFLQKKHSDTLEKLHSEIEELKQENKDLQFKSIMRKGVIPKSASLHSNAANEELKELRQMIKNARARNNMLHFALRKLGVNVESTAPTMSIESSRSDDSFTNELSCYDPERENSVELLSPLPTIILPLGATLNPLRVWVEGQKPRTPNIGECDLLIRHLYKANLKQMEENIQLRSDLRSLLFAKDYKERNLKKMHQSGERLLPLPGRKNSKGRITSPLLHEVNLSMSDDLKGGATPARLSDQKAYMSQADRNVKKIEVKKSRNK